jgi:ABC-2 type transport system permease protein
MPANPEPPPERPSAEAGVLYDLGYRGYDGPRLARRHPWGALYGHSLRAAFGLARGGRALFWPWSLVALASLPAFVQAAVSGVTGGQAELVSNFEYLVRIQSVLALFCAGQAPELVSGDQRHTVLPLYFSRGLGRAEYALVKLAAMVSALLLVAAAPMAILFAGRLGATDNLRAALDEIVPLLFPIAAGSLVSALVLGSIALAVASFTRRRGYAAAGILGVLLLSAPVTAALAGAAPDGVGRWAVLLSPIQTVGGTLHLLFGEEPAGQTLLGRAGLPAEAPLASAMSLVLSSVALLVLRYRRVRV